MENLAVTILGYEKTTHFSDLFKLISQCGCTVLNSRLFNQSTEFSAQLLLNGTWNAIAKFEASLSAFENKHDLKCLSIRTPEATPSSDHVPYLAYITAVEDHDVLHKITHFLQQQLIKIHDMSSSTYRAPITTMRMLSISLTFTIPSNKLISDFRESFIIFCDDNNFDAIIEPLKNL